MLILNLLNESRLWVCVNFVLYSNFFFFLISRMDVFLSQIIAIIFVCLPVDVCEKIMSTTTTAMAPLRWSIVAGTRDTARRPRALKPPCGVYRYGYPVGTRRRGRTSGPDRARSGTRPPPTPTTTPPPTDKHHLGGTGVDGIW